MTIPYHLQKKRVLIKNQETKRLLFSAGSVIKGNRGDECGWLESSGFQAPKMVGTDLNYYNRAVFVISPCGTGYTIESERTKRFCFSDGDDVTKDENGWKESSGFEAPCVVGSDDNYYGRAVWMVEERDGGYIFKNEKTGRVMLSDGVGVRCDGESEGGWLENSGFVAPDVKGSDRNYYGRSVWSIEVVEDEN